jgi:Zn finger protein HypA/HybF involved in hydrogenase expression
MKKPSEHLANLAAGQPPDDEDHILMLRCQDCDASSAWVEWVEFNSRCPDCGSTRAEVWTPKANRS